MAIIDFSIHNSQLDETIEIRSDFYWKSNNCEAFLLLFFDKHK